MALAEEAAILSSIFNDWYRLVIENKIPVYDFGGLYILAYLALRRAKKWSSGKFKIPLTSDEYISTKLVDIPHIVDLITEQYLIKLFGMTYHDISVVQIFATIRFTGIKKNTDDFVNQSIVQWALGKRPYILMTSIPTPSQVLRMQGNGQRVATAFLSEMELSSYHIAKLSYMEGHQNHSKDALEFFIHDLKHMENFVDPNTFDEQVGFFASLLAMSGNEVSPRNYMKTIIYQKTSEMISNLDFDLTSPSCQLDTIFKKRFQQLWNELEYLISDMYKTVVFSLTFPRNCYLPHLMKYFVAKLTINCHLLYEDVWTNAIEMILTLNTSQTSHSPQRSFDCYMRNIWIGLIQSLGIDVSCSREHPNPFGACLSMINHSLEHFPRVHLPKHISQEIEFCCQCAECPSYCDIHYTPQEEGKTLRIHFRESRYYLMRDLLT